MPKSSPKKPARKKTSSKNIRTRLRDFRKKRSAKPVALPGYVRFSVEVFQQLSQHKAVFARLILVSWIAVVLVVGVSQQAQYSDLSESADVFSKEFATEAYQASLAVGAVFLTVISGTLASTLTESQQIYTGAIYVFLWLIVVWLLRQHLAGNDVRVRDGLYNAGAPLLTTLTIVLVGLVQLLPAAIGVSLLTSSIASGVITGGAALVIFCAVVLLLGALSIYWLMSTFFAAIVVTIPGTYPWAALRSAKQLIAGQRVRVLLRMVWLGLISFIVFSLTLLPLIALDNALNHSASLLVALVLQLVSVSLFIYGSAYTYILYRRIIDERS
jgi:hypothetical protein